MAGSLAGYGVNKLMRKGMKKYNERQEQEARNLEERKRLISSGGNEIRGPGEELGGGTLNRLTGQRMKPPENRRVRQTNMILEGVQNIARQKVRDFEQNVRSSMGKIQTGLAETGQKIKSGLIESGLNMTLGKGTYARLPTEDHRSPYNIGDEGPDDYVILSKKYSKLKQNKDIDAQVQDLLGPPPQDMIILRPPPPLDTTELAFQDAAKVTNAAKTIQSAVRKRRASRGGTNVATLNRNGDGTAQLLLQNTGIPDSSNPLIPFSGEGRRVSGARTVSYTHLTLPTKVRCRSRWSPYH